jgi:hypothetical protein
MSGPIMDASQRWGLVFFGDGGSRPAHTRSEWACIARAITGADADLASCGDPARMRGDSVWCQTALDIYTQLRDAGAFGELDHTAEFCFADRTAIHAWLRAPVVPLGDAPQTMLEAEGLDQAFPTDARTDPLALPLLVERAQDVGVFGVPGNRVRLWPCVGSRATQPYTYTLTISPLGAVGLSGWPTYVGHVLNLDRPQADTIVSALTQVADLANHLIETAHNHRALASTADRADRLDRLPRGVDGYPLGRRVRGFPQLSNADTVRSIGAPAPSDTGTDRSQRGRNTTR